MCKQKILKSNKINACSEGIRPLIMVKITDSCNAYCDWCIDKWYGHGKHLKINIEEITKQILSEELKNFNEIIITGGEPFTVLDKVIELCKNIKEKSSKRIILNTNGYFISKTTINLLNDLIDELQISIHHYTSNGNVDVFKNINYSLSQIKEGLKEAKFKIIINTNITEVSENDPNFMEKMKELAKDLGASKIRFNELRCLSDSDEKISLKHYLTSSHPFYHYDDIDLIEKGCTWNEFDNEKNLEIAYKRACPFGDDREPTTDFKRKYFLENFNEKTFRVIYQDGSIYTDWVKEK